MVSELPKRIIVARCHKMVGEVPKGIIVAGCHKMVAWRMPEEKKIIVGEVPQDGRRGAGRDNCGEVSQDGWRMPEEKKIINNCWRGATRWSASCRKG